MPRSPVRILSCNIRTSHAEDGRDSWENRKDFCVELIVRQSADIICFQEVTRAQLPFLAAALPGYGALSTLDRPVSGEPYNTIFYRADDFRVVSQGAYWLSETPHVQGSKSWDSDCIRYVSWAHLKARDGSAFRVLNTHLDHVSQPARDGQARLLNEDAAAYPPDFPQVLAGDMNADAPNPAIAAFLAAGWQDTYHAVHGVLEPGRTFHEFLGPASTHPQGKIDWIFVRGAFRVTGARIIRDSRDGQYPSDHFFVSADVEPAAR